MTNTIGNHIQKVWQSELSQPNMPIILGKLAKKEFFPPHLLNYFKYAATIDGGLFSHTFGFTPRYGLKEIFAHYRNLKS